MLKIINRQKELAEIKNDLISNITHEFKTPITTVSTAIEAIDNFNMIDDKEKTKKYLSISSTQLKKLHFMVEKLLETATLDSEQLMLKKESINLIDLVEKITKKHQLITSEKKHLYRITMNKLYELIDKKQFIRIHRSIVINKIYIKKCIYMNNNEYKFELKNGEKLTSSRSYSNQISEYLSK